MFTGIERLINFIKGEIYTHVIVDNELQAVITGHGYTAIDAARIALQEQQITRQAMAQLIMDEGDDVSLPTEDEVVQAFSWMQDSDA